MRISNIAVPCASLALAVVGLLGPAPTRAAVSPGAEEDALEIVAWNVWNGFSGGSQLAAATEWLAREAPDVVALQELCGLDEEALRAASAGWGHPHAVMAKETGYPVGLTSRSPIEVVERRLEGMHHGYLHARTAGLDVVVVHLHPGSWEFRRREVEVVAPLVERLVAEERDVVVLGDFNAHHPLDCAHLAKQAPLIERRSTGANLIDGRVFDYGVLARFAEAGVTDPVHRHLGPSAASIGTYPSRALDHAATEESQRGFLERIDFVLLSPTLARRCIAARLSRGAPLDEVSDHYPVAVTIRTAR
ncbi:MAG: endonuclease/exonuclease/phosphatase family protein [Planctomycetota bacterium]